MRPARFIHAISHVLKIGSSGEFLLRDAMAVNSKGSSALYG